MSSNRIQAELEALRNKKLAQQKRKNLKSDAGPLQFTTADGFYDKQRELKKAEAKSRNDAKALLRRYKGYFIPGASKEDEKKILEEAANSGISVDEVAKKYGFQNVEQNDKEKEKLEEVVPNSDDDDKIINDNIDKAPEDQEEDKKSVDATEEGDGDDKIISENIDETVEGQVEVEKNVDTVEEVSPDGGLEDASGNEKDAPIILSKEKEEEENDDEPIEASADNDIASLEVTDANESSENPELDEESKDESQKPDVSWRNYISDKPGSKFPPESGRYHLITAMACPWAHRTMIVRGVKGLEDVISISIVHPVWQRTKPEIPNDNHCGWVFANPDGPPLRNTTGLGGPFPPAFPNTTVDPINNSFSVRDLYELAGDKDGKYTVPLLWDKTLNTIVSNESAEIIRMFNGSFNKFAKNPEIDLHPKELSSKIDHFNSWIYPTLNNGVYKCGLAISQTAYDEAIDLLTSAFDRVASILQNQPFLAGDTFTEADVRLFVTLIRFDEIYVIYFKTNTRSVAHTPSLLDYCRRVYKMPGVSETCDFDQIKMHYFCSHPSLNKLSIIPRGPNFKSLIEKS